MAVVREATPPALGGGVPAGNGAATCPHSGVCGGCSYRDIPYQEQLCVKGEQLRGFLDEAGVGEGVFADGTGDDDAVRADDPGGADDGDAVRADSDALPRTSYTGVAPAPRTSAYRNRMDYSFGDEVKDGAMTLGLHKRGSYMSVIDTDG
ncbi:MAG: hypothetical protein LBJ91_07440, partial [Clostridiales Family XIII bacterium]|nr:hypothetical protein [Clostridiales Family XIII bacterium]